MLEYTLLLKGLLIGLSIAAAVGPIAILCIQRTIAKGFKAGFSVGLGAALADSFYSLIAGTGLVTLSAFLIQYENIIAVIGSLFLFWLGLKTLKTYSIATDKKSVKNDESLFRLFIYFFFLFNLIKSYDNFIFYFNL